MRQVIGAVFVSLDGVIQAPGHPDEDRSGVSGWGASSLGKGDTYFFEKKYVSPLRRGDHIRCAAAGQLIPLEALRY